ncbi:hypothetical protein C6497_06290 [Candidatus Poribacteria bacterium]|nr:MAG: hypothetical protein C6497_06290 [Candidatus Poribacteria bacterium]
MNDDTMTLPTENNPEATSILVSMKVRQQLLDTLNYRATMAQEETEEELQEWVGELKNQQLKDLDLYKGFLISGSPQQPPSQSYLHQELEPETINTDGWEHQFADGFIGFLGEQESPMLEIWLGRKYSYPNYIGFDVMKLGENFNFTGRSACWIAVNLIDERVYAGLHFRDPIYFQELEREKTKINDEFIEGYERHRTLEWRPAAHTTNIHRIFVLIGIDNGNNQELLFPPLCKALEKMVDIFGPRVDEIYSRHFTRTHSLF